MSSHFSSMVALSATLSSVFLAGCVSLVTTSLRLSEPEPMSSADWEGVRQVRVWFHVSSSVHTQEPDWEQTALGVAAGLAGGLVAGAIGGVGAIGSAVGAISSAAQLGTGILVAGPATKDDSERFSDELKKSCTTWRLTDVSAEKLRVVLRRSTAIPVEMVEAISEVWEKEFNELKDAPPEVVQTKAKERKEIHTLLIVWFRGKGEPYLDITLSWSPWEGPFPSWMREMTAQSEEDQKDSFKIIEVPTFDDKELKKHRRYHFETAKHTREEWVKDNCAALKQELERGLDQLLPKMARDLFPGANPL